MSHIQERRNGPLQKQLAITSFSNHHLKVQVISLALAAFSSVCVCFSLSLLLN